MMRREMFIRTGSLGWAEKEEYCKSVGCRVDRPDSDRRYYWRNHW